MRSASRLLGSALVVAACTTGAEPNEGLHATVSLDRTRLVRGEVVQITVAVTSGTLQGSSTCLTGFSVLDASGTVVAPGNVFCTADVVTRSAAHAPYIRQFSWAGYTGSGTTGTPLPAGTYRIIGGTGASGQTHASVSEPVALELAD